MKITFWIYPLLLALIAGFIAGANYTPDTWLTGWDTLHPEINFGLAFERMLGGVWRADQGLGAVAIQSHMADAPRVILLWLSSFVVPANLLRYAVFLTALAIGPVGVYTLSNYIVQHKKLRFTGIFSFLAGILYIANLATAQHFAVPLEMFAFHYALIPWLFWSAMHVVETGSKKYFLLFCLFTLLAAPQAHTATLFYAYLAMLAVTLGTLTLLHIKNIKRMAVRAGILLGATVLLNAFWLLPNLYAVSQHAADVRESKINQLFTPEAFAKNQEFGTINDVAIAKNFLFDWELRNPTTGIFEPVMAAWSKHLSNPLVASFGYVVFFLALLGIIEAFWSEHKRLIALLPVFAVSFLMMLNATWPVTNVFDWLSQAAPIVKESLRFPFTKFSILYVMTLALFASYGLHALTLKVKRVKALTWALPLGLLIWAGYFFAPALTGNLIHPSMRLAIPNEYFELFAWFTKQPKQGRVAILPIHSMWGWTYYDWGYQGAGFLQFGIPQPILDRDYDRWSPYNEQYQREMSYAVYSQHPENVRMVLMKYNVRWVLLDTSVMAPGDNDNVTLAWLLPSLLDMAEVSLVAEFGDHIKVFSVQNPTSEQSAALYNEPPAMGPIISDQITKTERYTGDITAATEVAGRINFSNTDEPGRDHIALPDLSHDRSYVLEITSRNVEGFPLQLCVSNDLTSHCDLFVHLHGEGAAKTERFFLPKLDDHGAGYTLNFNNFTIRGRTSINKIESIRIAKPTSQASVIHTSGTLAKKDYSVYRYAPWLYRVSMRHRINASTLALNQSFENGWIALQRTDRFPFFALLKDHVLINNWSNGWVLRTNELTPDELTAFIVFWPQLLEWLGFLMLPIPFLFMLKKK